ncbi:MAG: RNA chaperone Hfq [Bacillota bacterium]
MSKTQINLQDAFLNQLRKESIPATVFLINGFQLKGIVRGFDNFTVILETDGKQSMVYKHAISTVSPVRPVSTNFAEAKPANQ